MSKISTGDMVVPRLRYGADRLFLWSNENPCMVQAEVFKGEILTVLKIEKFSDVEELRIQKEWAENACLLLRASGETGWTGSGWIRRITNGP